jgi:hypothetical protein
MSKQAKQPMADITAEPKLNEMSKTAPTTAATGAKDASKLLTNSTGVTDPKATAN